MIVLSCSGLLIALVGFSYLSVARESLAEERRRVASEVVAFDRFADRIAAADPAPAGQVARSAGKTLLFDPGDDGLQMVRRAYQETVMAMDHYEADYDEPLAEHMHEDLGPDVTTAVSNGPGFTPGLQTALVDAAGSASQARQSMLENLDDEAAALSAAEDALSAVQQTVNEVREAPRITGFDALVNRWHRMQAVDERCLDTVRDRYHSLADRNAFHLTAYLYDDFVIPAPVLAEAASVLKEAREERRRTYGMLGRVV